MYKYYIIGYDWFKKITWIYINKNGSRYINIDYILIVLCVYSLLFMRFAWMVKPRNYLLLACHISNEAVQSVLLGKRIRYNIQQKNAKKLA